MNVLSALVSVDQRISSSYTDIELPQFSIFICILFILPTVVPVNELNMNYAVVAIGGMILLVASVWFAWGRFHFSGPVKTMQLDHSPPQEFSEKDTEVE